MGGQNEHITAQHRNDKNKQTNCDPGRQFKTILVIKRSIGVGEGIIQPPILGVNSKQEIYLVVKIKIIIMMWRMHVTKNDVSELLRWAQSMLRSIELVGITLLEHPQPTPQMSNRTSRSLSRQEREGKKSPNRTPHFVTI